MDREFVGIVFFGAGRAGAKAAQRAAGIPEGTEIVEWDGGPCPELPDFAHGRVTLNFTGYVPLKWMSEKTEAGWLPYLLEGVGPVFDGGEQPQITITDSATDNSFTLLVHWDDVDAEKVRNASTAIARSYKQRAPAITRFPR